MAKPLQKERENRTAEKKDLTFHPYHITPENAHTAVLLLESKENEILCHTLRAMTKFGAQDMQNRITLFELNAIRRTARHIENPELNIKRFALKVLAQLCHLPRGPEQLLCESSTVGRICTMLAKLEDVFVLEFASLVLAEMSREPLGCEQILSANILGPLFSRMKNHLDPDVQKNCLQIFSNLVDDPVCVQEVTKSQAFVWPPLLALMSSKFLATQHLAIKTVDTLIIRFNDQVVQKTFRASTGVLDLCDMIESYEFRDLHIEVLDVLRDYVETEENAAFVFQVGCIPRLLTYLDMALAPVKPHCFAVLCKLSFTANGRDALFETGTDLVFCHQLMSTDPAILADAATGVCNMTALMPSAVRMADTSVVETLTNILSDDAWPWFNVRVNALRALSALCRAVAKAAAALVEAKPFAILRNINKKPKDVPLEAQRLAVQCYLNLQNYHVCLKAMTNGDFIQELINITQRIDVQLKVLACKALTGLMVEQAAKDIFTARGGEQFAVHMNLHIAHVGLRTALCVLAAAAVSDDGADMYLALGTIHYMVTNKQARYSVPAWEPALEAILRHQPSAKLAYMGRLDVTDFTRDGFYVLKRLEDSFPTLEAIAAAVPPACTAPVLLAMMHAPPGTPLSQADIRTPYHSATDKKVSTDMTPHPRPRMPPVADDTNLRMYLYKLKIWFGDPAKSWQYIELEDAYYELRYREKCGEVASTLKQKALMLAEFVADQMDGLSQERDCSMPSVDLHLADLAVSLNSRIVGIGWVRCGGELERAVLYKVLADRLGLPCALHRAASARAWCEVAVPEPPDPEEHIIEEKYPAGLLRTNYMVDLMSRPCRLWVSGDQGREKMAAGASPAAPCAAYRALKPEDPCRCTQPPPAGGMTSTGTLR